MQIFKQKLSWFIVIMIITAMWASHVWRAQQPQQTELTPATLEQLINENRQVLQKLEKMREQIKAGQ